jgi:hypothetical protein
MEVNTTGRHLEADSAASHLIEFLQSHEESLGLTESQLYYDFPLYKT